MLEIVERDSHGEFIARPANWPEEHGRLRASSSPRASRTRGRPPASAIACSRASRRLAPTPTPLPGAADQAASPRHAKPARHLPRPSRRPRRHRSGRPQAAEESGASPDGATNDAENGELVRFELGGPARFGGANARVTEQARQSARSAGDEPHRHSCPRHSRYLPGSRC